jgi:putative two-component system response regulator
MKGSKIFVVEDELITAENIRESLTQSGYRVTGVAGTGEEALRLIAGEPPELVLLDIKLKGAMDGIEVANRINVDFDMPVIFLTAFSDSEIVERAKETLSYGFLIKPFETRELISNIEIAIEKHGADRKVRESEARLRIVNDKLSSTITGIVGAMAMAVETRDYYTAGHQRRVSDLAGAIAREMALPADVIEGIILAASIHDIGKLGVPVEILTKPTRLNELEFQLIKTHSRAGFDILKSIDFPWPIAEIVHQHHERANGTGYPKGLAGVDILMEARIISVADVVEAIASHRPYRPALGIDAAISEITKNRGILFDPAPVDACLSIFKGGFAFTKTDEAQV